MFGSPHTHPDEPTSHERRTLTTQFDPASGRALSTDVVESVAAVLDAETTAITPLYEVVDPTALDSLFDSTPAEADGGPITVSFRYETCRVTVRSDGRIVVSAPDRDRR